MGNNFYLTDVDFAINFEITEDNNCSLNIPETRFSVKYGKLTAFLYEYSNVGQLLVDSINNDIITLINSFSFIVNTLTGGVLMINFIKNYNLQTIEKKFQILFFLILTNLLMNLIIIKIFSSLGINIIFFNSLYMNYLSVITLTTILPAVLLLILFYRMQNATNIQLKRSNILINLLILFSCIPICINFYNIYPLI